MSRFEMSGRALARKLGKSEGYVRERLNGTYEFTLADVEAFAKLMDLFPEDFIGAIDRVALEESLKPKAPETMPQIPGTIPITEIRRRRNVGSPVQDLREVAAESITERSDTDADYDTP